LAAIGGHCADRVTAGGDLAEPHREREVSFLTRLDRALDDARVNGEVVSLGVVAVVTGSPLSGITDLILQGILAPRHVVHRTHGGQGDVLIWLLLPGVGETDIRAMMARIEDLTRQQLERSLAEAGGTAAFRILTASDERSAVMAELERGVEARRGRR